MKKVICTLACLLLGVGATQIPSYIKVCYRNDPNVLACLLQSAKNVLPNIVNGDPRLNIPALDPLFVPEIKVKHGDDKFGLTIDVRDAKIYGLGKSDITYISVDTDKRFGELQLTVPKLTILTDYKVGGRVLILPIKGSGRGNFTLTDVTVIYAATFELRSMVDGKTHAYLTNSTVEFDMSRLYIHLENLFDGNKLLGDSMNIFLNDKWKELLTVLKPTLSETLITLSLNMINSIASALPYDEVYPPSLP